MDYPVHTWEPQPHVLSLPSNRKLLAAADILCILFIIVSAWSSSDLAINRPAILRTRAQQRTWIRLGTAVSSLSYIFLVSAYLLLSLTVVRAYGGTIDWIAIGVACYAWCLVVGLAVYQYTTF